MEDQLASRSTFFLFYNCYIIIEIGEEEVGLEVFVQFRSFDFHYSSLFLGEDG